MRFCTAAQGGVIDVPVHGGKVGLCAGFGPRDKLLDEGVLTSHHREHRPDDRPNVDLASLRSLVPSPQVSNVCLNPSFWYQGIQRHRV